MSQRFTEKMRKKRYNHFIFGHIFLSLYFLSLSCVFFVLYIMRNISIFCSFQCNGIISCWYSSLKFFSHDFLLCVTHFVQLLRILEESFYAETQLLAYQFLGSIDQRSIQRLTFPLLFHELKQNNGVKTSFETGRYVG